MMWWLCMTGAFVGGGFVTFALLYRSMKLAFDTGVATGREAEQTNQLQHVCRPISPETISVSNSNPGAAFLCDFSTGAIWDFTPEEADGGS